MVENELSLKIYFRGYKNTKKHTSNYILSHVSDAELLVLGCEVIFFFHNLSPRTPLPCIDHHQNHHYLLSWGHLFFWELTFCVACAVFGWQKISQPQCLTVGEHSLHNVSPLITEIMV